MTKRSCYIEQVFDAIKNERTYQDFKWGDIEQHPQDIAGWLLIVRKELEEAEHSWVKGNPDESLKELLQVVATGIAALEQHGIVERDYGVR